MICEAAVAIQASKDLALVSVSRQHARRSFVPQCTFFALFFVRVKFVFVKKIIIFLGCSSRVQLAQNGEVPLVRGPCHRDHALHAAQGRGAKEPSVSANSWDNWTGSGSRAPAVSARLHQPPRPRIYGEACFLRAAAPLNNTTRDICVSRSLQIVGFIPVATLRRPMVRVIDGACCRFLLLFLGSSCSQLCMTH